LARDILRSLHPHGVKPLTSWRVVVQVVTSPEVRIVVFFRLYSWLSAHGHGFLAFVLYTFVRTRTGCDLALGAKIGPGLRIEHRSDIVIGTAVLGSDVDVFNGVSVGKRRPPLEDEMPTIGNRVMLGTGAKVLGNVTVGDDAVVGANAVVVDDVPSGATVAGIPARVVGHRQRPGVLGG
jgi:serine O-acetyltransferase